MLIYNIDMAKCISTVFRTGNSKVVVIPASITKLLDIEVGDEILLDITKR
jgi:antitoxin component of MazEF toxin-antitoxin module